MDVGADGREARGAQDLLEPQRAAGGPRDTELQKRLVGLYRRAPRRRSGNGG
jgi:hypothetical protein